jgi:hypothetical protein
LNGTKGGGWLLQWQEQDRRRLEHQVALHAPQVLDFIGRTVLSWFLLDQFCLAHHLHFNTALRASDAKQLAFVHADNKTLRSFKLRPSTRVDVSWDAFYHVVFFQVCPQFLQRQYRTFPRLAYTLVFCSLGGFASGNNAWQALHGPASIRPVES